MNDADVDAAIAEINAVVQTPRKLAKRATLVYECDNDRKCVLLCVLTISGVRVVYQPRYKLSDKVNQRESVQAARDKHTEDGDRRWKAGSFRLAQAAGWLSVQCDHCRAKIDVKSIESDYAAATRMPTVIKLSNGDVR